MRRYQAWLGAVWCIAACGSNDAQPMRDRPVAIGAAAPATELAGRPAAPGAQTPPAVAGSPSPAGGPMPGMPSPEGETGPSPSAEAPVAGSDAPGPEPGAPVGGEPTPSATPQGGPVTTPTTTDAGDPRLPEVNGDCPTLATGNVTIDGSTARVWVGTKPGPVYIYWHGTGSSPVEVEQGFPGATAGVGQRGGLVASWSVSNMQGVSTSGPGWTVWFTGDSDAADQLIACANQAGLVDPQRIYTAGYSAGGLHAGSFVMTRTHYLAAAIIYSGGEGFSGARMLSDPMHPTPVLLAHGTGDMLVLDFAQQEQAFATRLTGWGGLAIECTDAGPHVNLGRLGVQGAAAVFLEDHPWSAHPSPYRQSGLPATFPSICKLWE